MLNDAFTPTSIVIQAPILPPFRSCFVQTVEAEAADLVWCYYKEASISIVVVLLVVGPILLLIKHMLRILEPC
jgi:hypothetical protein